MTKQTSGGAWGKAPLDLLNNTSIKMGAMVVSWKRQLESWITHQSQPVKASLGMLGLSLMAWTSIALATTAMPTTTPSDFEVYKTLRDTEAVARLITPAPADQAPVLVALGRETANDIIEELFGSTVHSKIPAAELVVRQPLQSPLPESVINNGKPPVPHTFQELAQNFNPRDLLWPMRAGYVSSRYGMRFGRMHRGTDIVAPYGTPIMAAAAGKVVFSGWESGYGKLIIVDHGDGVKTKYGHCSELLVKVGDMVTQGGLLGKVGQTGHATAPHLHYEVVRGGQSTNPEFFTRRR